MTQDCDPAVVDGVVRFFESVTIPHPTSPGHLSRHPSFSLTSRRYSVWSQLHEHLDKPVADLIHRCRGVCDFRLLHGFAPSSSGRKPPTLFLDREAGAKAKLYGHPVGDVVPFQQRTGQRPGSATDSLIETLWTWDENLHAVIQSVPSRPSTMQASKLATQLSSTMQTLRDLLSVLHHFRARRGSDPFGDQDGVHPQLPDSKTRHQGQTYCELCWRLTMRSAAMGRRSRVPDIRSRQLSNRFCTEHDPSDPTSRYRIDLRYKKSFQREVWFGMRSAFFANLKCAPAASMEEHRMAAYERAHARLRPPNQPDSPGLRETIWRMHQKGIRQSDIARQLGKSRQTVFRNLKRTKELLTQLEENREQHSQRAASETAQGQSTLTTLVATLAEEGFTQSEIANIVDAPKDLILSALRWVKDHPPLVSKKP